jgi:1-acyl-sn-glycerol-3-phosphate acyltransferase
MQITRLLLLARVEVRGKENIPSSGPYIVAINHNSSVDTPLLLIAFPLMRWRFFAVEKWRYHPLFGPIMLWLGAIYIKRGEVDRPTLRLAMSALEAGLVFGLAPEGTRSRTGSLMPAKDGAAYLASRVNTPILPVGLVNTDVLFANGRRLKRTNLEVRVGQPFRLPELGRRARGPDLAAFTLYIMVHIAELLPHRYHGYYANSRALATKLSGGDPWPDCRQAAQGGDEMPKAGRE